MEILVTLSGYIFSAVTGVVSWLAGTRSRKNSIYKELLETIATLTEQNSDLQRKVCQLQDELIAVRKENAELKSGQNEMTRQLNMLQRENQELKKLLTNK
jgi:chromosome segregation ATPase